MRDCESAERSCIARPSGSLAFRMACYGVVVVVLRMRNGK
jgi:hypothetical protein